MKAFKKKEAGSNLTRKRALDYTPVKNMDVTEIRLDSGEVILTYPLEMRPWIAGMARWLGRSTDRIQTKKIQLDTLGTSVWEQMDGKRSIREIIQEFVRKHQLHPKEAEVAVTQFLRNLGKRGLIGIK
jgi:hypothetical protein